MSSKIQALITRFLSTKTKREKILLLVAVIVLCVFVVMEFIYLPLLQTQSTLLQIHSHSLAEFALSTDSMHSLKEQQQKQTDEAKILQEQITLQTQSTLLQIHSHSLAEFALSTDSMHSLKEQQQKQTDEAKILQEQITTLQEMLNHTATQEPLLNPFALIPHLITFAQNENLTLNAFHPHPTLNALDIEGSGHTATQEPLLNPFALIPHLITFAQNENLTLNAFHPHPTLNALDIEGSGEFWQILNLLSFLESHHFLSLESLQLTLQENNQIHFYMLVMDIRQPQLQKQSPKE